MDKADGLGTGVAVGGHVALFAALSLGLAASIPPRPVPPPSMEVEFIDEVALEAAAPAPAEMQAAEAPEVGPPEEAAPQPAPAAEPLPEPLPQPVAKPTPQPVAKPIARPKPRPVVKPAPPKAAKPAPAKPVPTKVATAKPARTKPSASAATTKTASKKPATAASGAGEKTASRGSRLGKNFLAGLSDPAEGKAATAAPAMSANALAGIQAAIKRQIQPCANRQVNPGPGASRILVKLNLRLNKDGSLASAPRVMSTSGVDDENSRYEKRVADLAIAAYKGCAPMRGLPVDLYKTAKGGWSNVNMNYKLPG